MCSWGCVASGVAVVGEAEIVEPLETAFELEGAGTVAGVVEAGAVVGEVLELGFGP